MRNIGPALVLLGGLLAISGSVQATSPRTFTLVNNCPTTVFLGATAGGTTTACTKNSDCSAGQVCDATKKVCFWADLTMPSGASLDAFSTSLAANASTTISIPVATTAAGATVWSGTIWGGVDTDSSTQRTLANVASGYCGASQNAVYVIIPCTQDSGPANAPVTQVEFTLTNSQDNYDITAINGVNLALQMGPANGGEATPIETPTDPNDKYYNCAVAGAATDTANAAQACTWSFTAKNQGIGMALVQYQSGIAVCKPNATCPTGQVCGLAFNPAEGVTGVHEQCGVPLAGSWTAAQICVAAGYDNNNLTNVSSSLKSKLDCGGANTSLLKCTGDNAGSCYSNGADTSCCGCPNWPAKYKPSGGNQAVANRCYNNNTSWQSVSFPWLSYVKKACPTMYSYPFDDATSSFHCSTVAAGKSGTNTQNYTVTFCPAGSQAKVRK